MPGSTEVLSLYRIFERSSQRLDFEVLIRYSSCIHCLTYTDGQRHMLNAMLLFSRTITLQKSAWSFLILALFHAQVHHLLLPLKGVHGVR